MFNIHTGGYILVINDSKISVTHAGFHHCLGGGSALLPAPIPPITLQEKLDVTCRLAGAGATIQELNTIRRALSLLKGGGLAHHAHPAQVTDSFFSLLLNRV